MATKRSERKNMLNELLKRKVLSEEGLNSLTKCVDPFHDLDIECIGIPDQLPEKSIVREVRKTLQISGANDFPEGTVWDCHIYTLPSRLFVPSNNTTRISKSGVMYGDGNFSSTGGYWADFIAPVVVIKVPTANPTLPDSGTFNPGTFVWDILDFNDFSGGQSREIFSGLEVHNVTNQLNVAGTVTCYRMPQFAVDVEATGDGSPGTFAKVMRMPPATIEEALLLPGSRQWEARHGAYVVETYDMEENRPQTTTFQNQFLVRGDFTVAQYLAGTTLPGIGLFAVPPSESYQALPSKFAPKDTSGIYFTGLPWNSTLTLTVRKGIETFPTFTDPLVTLARSTPAYDPAFFELYKLIAQHLPPGVAVGENASGDFWDKILGIVQDVAPTIGSAFGPAGGIIGGLVSKAAKAGQEKRNAKVDDTNFKGGKAIVKTPASLTRR
jgi:hypothetical protein